MYYQRKPIQKPQQPLAPHDWYTYHPGKKVSVVVTHNGVPVTHIHSDEYVANTYNEYGNHLSIPIRYGNLQTVMPSEEFEVLVKNFLYYYAAQVVGHQYAIDAANAIVALNRTRIVQILRDKNEFDRFIYPAPPTQPLMELFTEPAPPKTEVVFKKKAKAKPQQIMF